jgi:uncharacterized protein with HEPN domain
MQDQIKDIDRLLDIQEFSNLILEHMANIEEQQFYNSRLLQFALLKMLENIGEAAYQISRATRAEFTVMEWDKMIGARHVYVHDYFKVDWTKIWVSLNTIDFKEISGKAEGIIKILKRRFSL